METKKRLVDAKRKFVLNSGNMTGHIMCVENEYATVFDRFAKMICTFNLLDAPTVDAVEVIRCKDCKWVYRDKYSGVYFCHERQVRSEHFCSYGERRTDGR